MINVTRISSDELINQISDTLAEVDVDFLCDIADKVLSAKHSAVGMTPDGYDLIDQKYEEPEDLEDPKRDWLTNPPVGYSEECEMLDDPDANNPNNLK